ncbi:DUF1249 domain-containing protein [Aliikangiella sp. IMCC44632]
MGEKFATLQSFQCHSAANIQPESQMWQLSGEQVKLSFYITDAARYTTTIRLSIESPNLAMVEFNHLIIRLYHDAQMMEVMEGAGPSALPALYPKGHKSKMADEKYQVNRFINECLRACSHKKITKTRVQGVEK